MVKMSIFKAYDIRGIFPDELNKDMSYKIGIAVSYVFRPKKVLVARDMRLSSPVLAKALIKGLIENGTDVVYAGLCSTPMFYFIMAKNHYDLGIMITASHNPKEYNGMKFMKKGNIAINYETGLFKIERFLLKEKGKKSKNKGKLEKKDFRREYWNYLLSKDFKDVKDLKIVIDAGNGMISYSAKSVLEKIPVKIIKLNFKLDGSFPSHGPNPLVKGAMKQLKKAVIRHKADLGVVFDGDADRIFFVDDKGKEVNSSIIACMIAEDFAENNKKRIAIVHDAMSSRIIKERLKGKAKVVRTKVGYSYISKALRKYKAVFGAEVSGHYSYKENFYCDSGIITFLKVLKILAKKGKRFSEIVSGYKKYFNSGEINFKVDDKEKILGKIEKYFKNKKAKIDKLDGLTINYNDWWAVIRPSNTEPLLRMRVEASSKNLLKEKVEEISKVIKGV